MNGSRLPLKGIVGVKSFYSLLGSSITYRIATGPRGGQKGFTLQMLPAETGAPRRIERHCCALWHDDYQMTDIYRGSLQRCDFEYRVCKRRNLADVWL